MTIAVLGAGTGGLAATVELTHSQHAVRLWNRTPARLEPHRPGGVRYTGIWGDGTAQPAVVTSDLAEAIDGVDAVVVCLPSTAHPTLFTELARLSRPAPIVLCPGHTGGALHLRQVFGQAGSHLPPVAEFSTLPYIGRVHDGVVHVAGRAKQIAVGPLPGGKAALTWAEQLFPGAVPVADVLASSLSNVNLVLHPPGAVLGASWVEATGGDFTFYVQGMTPGVGRIVSKLDAERLAVANALGHQLPTLVEEMSALGSVDREAARQQDVVGAIRGGVANRTIRAPDTFQHRYYQEDFAFGLMPFTAMARVAGIATPVADALLLIGDAAVGEGFADRGLGAQALGIAGMSKAELIHSVRARVDRVDPDSA